jgi:hypothetical protein
MKPTMPRYPQKWPVILGAFAGTCLLSVPLRAQQMDVPTSYTLTIGGTVTAGSLGGGMAVSMFDESGGQVGGGGGTGPNTTSPITPFNARIVPGKNYVVSTNAGSGCSYTLNFSTGPVWKRPLSRCG